jgi:hypothetical protein
VFAAHIVDRRSRSFYCPAMRGGHPPDEDEPANALDAGIR